MRRVVVTSLYLAELCAVCTAQADNTRAEASFSETPHTETAQAEVPSSDDAQESGDDASPAVPNPSPLVLAGVPNEGALAGPALVWKWSRFSTADYVVTGVGGALMLTAAIVRPRAIHSLSGGILFDDRRAASAPPQ